MTNFDEMRLHEIYAYMTEESAKIRKTLSESAILIDTFITDDDASHNHGGYGAYLDEMYDFETKWHGELGIIEDNGLYFLTLELPNAEDLLAFTLQLDVLNNYYDWNNDPTNWR